MMLRIVLSVIFMVTLSAAGLHAGELTGTLQQIKKSGKIKIGYRETRPPLSFLNKEGVPAGYSIELCQQIVAEAEKTVGAKLSVEYVPVSVDNRFDALVDNKIDLLCGATTKTISRGELVDFTQLTFVTGGSFMTLKETKLRNNFKDKKIGVLKDTTTVDGLNKLLKEVDTGAEVVLFDDAEAALRALTKGKIDAYAADQVVLIGMALSSGTPEKFAVLPELFSYEPFALAVKRNDADFRLVADRVIAELYRSKKILPLYDKWFGDFGQRSSAFDMMIQLNAIPE
jgi:ABC-type amino acid transport substrate-binding protein